MIYISEYNYIFVGNIIATGLHFPLTINVNGKFLDTEHIIETSVYFFRSNNLILQYKIHFCDYCVIKLGYGCV